MKAPSVNSIGFFYRPGNQAARKTAAKIKNWLKKKSPGVKLNSKNPQVLLVLGGDGTILEAARVCQKTNSLIMGLNLGTAGFLSSVRKPKDFLEALKKLLSGDYQISKRLMLETAVIRNKKKVFTTVALNEAVIINPLGMVKVKVSIEEHPLQYILGTGALVATATGSTAYNLSAHGPVVMPDLPVLILTELSDHNLPTPSLVLQDSKKITFEILHFRKRNLLLASRSKKEVDVLLVADGETIFPLARHDEITVTSFPSPIRFVEFEKNYFLKGLQDKFAFR